MVIAKWCNHTFKQIINQFISFVVHKACHVLFTLPKFAISQSEAGSPWVFWRTNHGLIKLEANHKRSKRVKMSYLGVIAENLSKSVMIVTCQAAKTPRFCELEYSFSFIFNVMGKVCNDFQPNFVVHVRLREAIDFFPVLIRIQPGMRIWSLISSKKISTLMCVSGADHKRRMKRTSYWVM